MDKKDLEVALAAFTDTVTHYRHWSRAYYYTDGVAFLAVEAGAQWLLDYIAAHQKRARRDRQLRDCQVWTLRMVAAKTARIACSDREAREVFGEDVPLLGGFPLDEVTLYFENETLMLPGERAQR